MHTLATRIANVFLFALAFCYLIELGGGNYEHINVTRIVSLEPPRTMAMLQGPFGFTPRYFWMLFHPLTTLFFVLALAFNWKAVPARRRLLVAAFTIHVLVSIATFAYFAPETGKIAAVPFSDTVDAAAQALARRWANLNLVRLLAYYLAAGCILLALNRPATSR
ncbi:MAG: hypothetical protein U0V64_14115 [Cyclobacteriaceae bacterium]